MTTLLAFDTSTEQMAVGLMAGERIWVYEGPGGAQASTQLLPTVLGLLRGAGVALADLDAIAFGQGPGAFTGLRTACSVAQGLALGANKPVVPVDTLAVVAEQAYPVTGAAPCWVALDARMGQIYAGQYQQVDNLWNVLEAPMLIDVELLNTRWRRDPPQQIAGNALSVFAGRLQTNGALCEPGAAPRPMALLRIARMRWERGAGVDCAQALPTYLRDKVAQTIVERSLARHLAAGCG